MIFNVKKLTPIKVIAMMATPSAGTTHCESMSWYSQYNVSRSLLTPFPRKQSLPWEKRKNAILKDFQVCRGARNIYHCNLISHFTISRPQGQISASRTLPSSRTGLFCKHALERCFPGMFFISVNCGLGIFFQIASLWNCIVQYEIMSSIRHHTRVISEAWRVGFSTFVSGLELVWWIKVYWKSMGQSNRALKI